MAISTNKHVFFLTFLNTNESFIVGSDKEMLELFKSRPNLVLNKIKEFDKSKASFKRTSKKFLLSWSDNNTDLHEILKKRL